MASSPPSDTDPAARLASYVDVWWAAVQDFLELADQVDQLDGAGWDAPTDLPGWLARDVLAHLAHLEAVAVGVTDEPVDVGDPPHVRNEMGRFTEQGVVARRDASPADLLAELRRTTEQRRDALAADPPTDPDAPAPTAFGAIGWDTETFLGNRPLDVWMHEQDVRRAVGLPGGLDGLPAAYCAQKLLRSVPFVVGKRVAPPVGTTIVLVVGALPPVAVRVDDDGRARPVAAEEITSPTAALGTDLETFCRASGGRGSVDLAQWETDGDADLARRVVEALAVTP
ncbi:maleylpyruvate isomerase family mycothiol-dependent enzyme [Nocardioides zeae]|uniref:Maleylpyruvate isomerase family mycothiol-dependent enzyme n=1 Tax=Nocardioides imazamoxiresistens TaxID=3231893 RepID=A0ABU3PVT2_9ACTN|nr:maleylpyruvate isomerase family mycothiol-dependent enzyme [Nocardioides zeae]MDT9593333.1 maleylpyruvate isomerase family mycothiol-dependent enzyme [Nocardioides zeae]